MFIQLRRRSDTFFIKAFAAVDENGDGILTLEEIQKLAFVAGIQITQKDMAQFKKIVGWGAYLDACLMHVSIGKYTYPP